MLALKGRYKRMRTCYITDCRCFIRPPRPSLGGGSRGRDRAGYVLVLFVMMFLGLMGLAALVIDLGFARLAQRQMQSAVDSAALEGLRWRDVQQGGSLPPAWLVNQDFQNQTGGVSSTGSLSPQQPDSVRRWAASNRVANLFTDLSGGSVQYGAGPVVNFSGGNGPADLAASQFMSPGAPPVYQARRSDGTPGLELNQGPDFNAANGDMSSGTYNFNTSYGTAPVDNLNGSSGTAQSADEDAYYNRRDFAYSAGTADSASAPAFLVRMRRTNNLLGLDQESGVSTSGPTLPILFGRGSMMARNSGSLSGSSSLSVASGIVVRAAGIAAAGDGIQFGGTSGTYSAGRAKTAGPPWNPYVTSSGSIQIPGITPFALTLAFWDGSWTSNDIDLDDPGGVITGIVPTQVIKIGQSINASVQSQAITNLENFVNIGSLPTSMHQYVPIYDGVANYNRVSNVVVGFGFVQWYTYVDGMRIVLHLSRAPQSQLVGYGNLSGVLVPGLPNPDTTDLNDVFHANATFLYPVYAPVLVNRRIGPNGP